MVDVDPRELSQKKAEQLEERNFIGVPDGVRIEIPLGHKGHPNHFRVIAEALRMLANELELIGADPHRSVASSLREAWWLVRECDRRIKARAKPSGNVVKLPKHPLEK